MAEIAPLEAVKKMTAEHPKLWDLIDRLVKMSEVENVVWDRQICYCPISAAISALSYDTDMQTSLSQASFASALASWRRGKFIYRFDSSLAAEILNMADDIVIPTEILYQMPAQCIYVELIPSDDKTVKADTVMGFFAHIESDVNNGEKELRIHYINRDGNQVAQYIVHLIRNGTINDGIDESIKTMRKNLVNSITDHLVDYINNTRDLIIQAVQLVLYICAENADIEEDEAQSKIYRKSDRILDKYREIKKYDVGAKIGVILRQNKRYPNYSHNAGSGAGNHKRSHLRRAHWHHFWTGSANDKKLVLRWVNSIIVNQNDETSPTIIKVNKKD